MEEEVLVGDQKSRCDGRCFSDDVHDGGEIKSLHPVEVHTHIRI